MLRQDWQWLLLLEEQRAAVAHVKREKIDLLEDLTILVDPCVRVMFMAFEEANFHHRSPGGIHFLSGLLNVLPDSKIVEDAHGVLRVANKALKNRRMTNTEMQNCLRQSPILGSRDIDQKARVTKEVFCEKFKTLNVNRPSHHGLGLQNKKPLYCYSKIVVRVFQIVNLQFIIFLTITMICLANWVDS